MATDKFHILLLPTTLCAQGWSGGAMVLGEIPLPGHSNLDYSKARPIALEVGAGGAIWTGFLSSIISLSFLPLSGRRPSID